MQGGGHSPEPATFRLAGARICWRACSARLGGPSARASASGVRAGPQGHPSCWCSGWGPRGLGRLSWAASQSTRGPSPCSDLPRGSLILEAPRRGGRGLCVSKLGSTGSAPELPGAGSRPVCPVASVYGRPLHTLGDCVCSVSQASPRFPFTPGPWTECPGCGTTLHQTLEGHCSHGGPPGHSGARGHVASTPRGLLRLSRGRPGCGHFCIRFSSQCQREELER